MFTNEISKILANIVKVLAEQVSVKFNINKNDILSFINDQLLATDCDHNMQSSKTMIFIDKARRKHGAKYTYSKVKHINAKTKVIITCSKHGDFEQTPNGHLAGRGCRTCGREAAAAKFSKGREQFIKEATEKHGDKYDYSKVEYINAHTNVIIICPKHGEINPSPKVHLTGSGCYDCSGKTRMNNEIFIERAKRIHGDRYDYSLSKYTKMNNNVSINCPAHGIFIQTPSKHILSQQGCFDCSLIDKQERLRIINEQQFIKEATNIHNGRYNYSKVEYIDAKTPVIIICPEHDEIPQAPYVHKNSYGCSKCVGRGKSREDIIEEFRDIHGDKYDYKKFIKFRGVKYYAGIICKEHGLFPQTVEAHRRGAGCSKCIGHQKSTDDIIKEFRNVHGDTYDYSKVNYNGTKNTVTIICKKHGEFPQLVTDHRRGSGCSKCIGRNRTTEEFIAISIKQHGDKYDYSDTIYVDSKTKVKIRCKHHNITFEQNIHSHMNGMEGCYKCNSQGYSKLAIRWLNNIMINADIFIQHAQNLGEYNIPGTRYKADGYCEQTNTIYEFHGDYWHCNPNVYHCDEINKTVNKTMGELYNNTIRKEQKIKELRYNLIVMWEYDYVNSM